MSPCVAFGYDNERIKGRGDRERGLELQIIEKELRITCLLKGDSFVLIEEWKKSLSDVLKWLEGFGKICSLRSLKVKVDR